MCDLHNKKKYVVHIKSLKQALNHGLILNYVNKINYISEDLSIIEMNKTKVKMNKPIYLGLSRLDISKILMYKIRYDYINQNMVKK